MSRGNKERVVTIFEVEELCKLVREEEARSPGPIQGYNRLRSVGMFQVLEGTVRHCCDCKMLIMKIEATTVTISRSKA